tara:strand:- start:853 stop:1002 length:150 start_codon:yes stop_codon:yes gene_type:complete
MSVDNLGRGELDLTRLIEEANEEIKQLKKQIKELQDEKNTNTYIDTNNV